MANNNMIQKYRLKDLVLEVKIAVDRTKWNEDKYARFLEELCEDRDYQKEAILTSLRYLLGGEYKDLRHLAKENWNNNEVLRSKHSKWENLEDSLQLPDKLAASIDLATGTGKTYVMYGIAAILLAEGTVDQVLVLCPSTTIESGLLSKFRLLSSDPNLLDSMPEDSIIRMPSIIDGSQSIVPGSICIENRDAIYEHVNSSIKASLIGKGNRTAVLNDEAHHVAQEQDAKIKRWKEFLENKEYSFNLILGFSGTCYVKNEYFTDVIYRFSLKEAIEQRFVKQVKYRQGDDADTGEEDEKWQLILGMHRALRNDLKKRNIKPLSIIVTSSIKTCERVANELRDVLIEYNDATEDEVEGRVIVVYNNSADVRKLKDVDDKDSAVEWIVSVSMLNEGWDVKRVFQIVPHEERAFNSKLLIAQVLGRGLRIPDTWIRGTQPEVVVFNHAAWANSIKHLVDEILENEKTLTCLALESSIYNFDLHNLGYSVIQKSEERIKKDNRNIIEKDLVDLPSEGESIDVSVEFTRAVKETKDIWNTTVNRTVYEPEEVAQAMYRYVWHLDKESSSLLDISLHTSFSKIFPYERCLNIVRNSLKGDTKVSERNKQRLLAAIGEAVGITNLSGKRVVRYDYTPDELFIINTIERPADKVSASQLRWADKSVYITEHTKDSLDPIEGDFFDEVNDQESEYRHFTVTNFYDFKTPLNLVIADSGPERTFIRELIKPENANEIDAWVKSNTSNFYGIKYSMQKGDLILSRVFHPDFFIKLKHHPIVVAVEIKDDTELSDPSPENIYKNERAISHFNSLNRKLLENDISVSYQFHFITPQDRLEFFSRIREGTINTYRSKLDWKLNDVYSQSL